MSDAFDPDAWPHTPASSGSRSSGGEDDFPRRTDDDDDSYDPLNVDDPHGTYAEPGGGYGDDDETGYDGGTFSDAGGDTGYATPDTGYGSDDDAGYGTPGYGDTGADTGASPGNTAYGAPSSGYGGTDYGDDDYANDNTYDYGGIDDDDEPTTAQPTQPRATAHDDDYDDYGYDSYDDEDDSYGRGNYDDYDDFEEQGEKTGGARKLLITGGVIVGVLLLLVVGLSALGGKKGNNQAGSTTTTAAQSGSNSSDTNTTLGNATTAPTDVTNALNQALAAWGQFAVDGNLDDVRPYFVNSGPQFTHFEAEAPNISGNPPGGAPLTFSMTNPQAYNVDANNWIIRGTVVVSRTGNANQSFPWEIRLTRQNAQQPWQVLTVRQY